MIFFLIHVEKIVGVSYTYITTETYIQGCTILSVHTITICVLFSYFQYQVVLDLILLGYAYLTEISPALNTCQYVLLLSFNITVLERNLTTQYPIVDRSVVLMEPYSHICTRDSILSQIISSKTL